jgi:PA14 domain
MYTSRAMRWAYLGVLLGLACSQRNPAYLVQRGDDAPAEIDAAVDLATDREPDASLDRSPDVSLEGTGLHGSYYAGVNFDTFVFSRVDPFVDFAWGTGSPDPRLAPTNFSVRWTGTFRPRYSETYTLGVHSGDGARLTIGGTLVVDNWRFQAPEEHSGTIQLTANRVYDIKLEYFHGTGWAVVRIRWESASQRREVMPVGTFTPVP